MRSGDQRDRLTSVKCLALYQISGSFFERLERKVAKADRQVEAGESNTRQLPTLP